MFDLIIRLFFVSLLALDSAGLPLGSQRLRGKKSEAEPRVGGLDGEVKPK